MKDVFWMSGEIEGDVYDSYRIARNEVEATILAGLQALDFGNGFKRLTLIPIIREVDHPDYDEVRRYHKRDRDFEFRLRISHAAFKVADAVGQRRLIVENILRAVDEMRKLRVKDVDCEKLEQAIRDVAASKGWLPPSMIH
jgi:Immunity protein 44